MKVNVYTKDDKVQYIELNVEVGEYFLIQKALINLSGDIDANVEDRLLAVMMSDNMKDKEQIELNDFIQEDI